MKRHCPITGNNEEALEEGPSRVMETPCSAAAPPTMLANHHRTHLCDLSHFSGIPFKLVQPTLEAVYTSDPANPQSLASLLYALEQGNGSLHTLSGRASMVGAIELSRQANLLRSNDCIERAKRIEEMWVTLAQTREQLRQQGVLGTES